MTTGYCDPNGDATVTDSWSGASPHYTRIDDGVRYPTTTGMTEDNLYLYYYGDNTGDVALSMTTLTGVQQVTSIKVWIFGGMAGGGHFHIDISKDGTNWVGEQTVAYFAYHDWQSKTFSGLTWTQTDLDNLQIRLKGHDFNGAEDYEGYIDEMYAEITYTAGMKINIGDVWKDISAIKINIGDVWKDVAGMKINIGDVWKTVF